MNKSCDACEYWLAGRPEDCHPNDQPGECRRNAPRPTLGAFEHEIMKFLSSLAWDVSEEIQRLQDFNAWEEAEWQTCAWPRVPAGGWCGEWKPREEVRR